MAAKTRHEGGGGGEAKTTSSPADAISSPRPRLQAPPLSNFQQHFLFHKSSRCMLSNKHFLSEKNSRRMPICCCWSLRSRRWKKRRKTEQNFRHNLASPRDNKVKRSPPSLETLVAVSIGPRPAQHQQRAPPETKTETGP
jgi:hypothetical protein